MGLLDDRTEPATPKKREDARKKGQVCKSREVISVAVLTAGYLSVRAAAPRFWSLFTEQAGFYLTTALQPDRMSTIDEVPIYVMTALASILVPLLVAVGVAALIANVGQTGPMLSGQGLKWDPSKLNPGQGLKRMASTQSLAELVKALCKVGFVSWVVCAWLRHNYPQILMMSEMSLQEAGRFAAGLLDQLFWRTIGALTVIAAADYAYQRYTYEMSLRMSRQEIRDEMRQSELAPEVRGAIRRKMRQMLRGRMMQAVRTATVVVTNPTHYAVALRYDPAHDQAPEVVATGQRLTALKIREIARESRVPLVENPPLARALFSACDVGDAVPPELYAAVAEVLAYVYRLTGRQLPGAPGR
ncbi:MAG: flagellar biosynthesis protein FlhB [Armatimonadetes bacterium]|nr:flagellar biosynthesis protein FlhB [Armatimonadota bacterium]